VTVLGHLLYPYKVELSTEADRSDLIICRDHVSDSSEPLVRVPTRSDWQVGHHEPTSLGNRIVDLPFDLVSVCSKIFEKVMRPRVAFVYRLCTRLPIQYNVVPSSIRSYLLKIRKVDSNLPRHVATETCRKILVEAVNLLGFHLERKRPPSLIITHDIETEKGLRRALSLKSVEDELKLQSTWFLPSDEYPISRYIARELADGSRIGSHDIKHAGRLISIKRHDQLAQRMRDSRLKLEEIFEKEVKCFRSPLLQFSDRIMAAAAEAGYHFDFSVPCWEPVHPPTMAGFGVESVQAFEVDNVVEFPLTLFQDHQMLSVLGMNTREAVRLWVEQARTIRSLDGDTVLCVHPDYSFSRDLLRYRELLTSLLEVQSGNPVN